MARYELFASRVLHAIRLGFPFFGTSRTPFPSSLKLAGRALSFQRYNQPSEVHDLIDVVLDDSYGLRQAKEPRIIVDIGSNIGLFSAYAKHLFPKATVHAYEPDPTTSGMARANLNGLATVFQEGVSGAAGKARMHQRTFLANTNQTVQDANGDITLVPFSEVVRRAGGFIDLLKVDCEGAEWSFMTDPEPFRNVRCVRMEYHLNGHAGQSMDDVRAMAKNLGYRVTLLEPKGKWFGLAWMDR